jgi:hypothetical protein
MLLKLGNPDPTRGTQLTLPLRTPDDHVVTDIDGRRVLIDTGSAVTLGRDAGSLSIGPAIFPITLVPEFDLDTLSSLVGETIDVVLGNDVLAHTSFEIRLRPDPGVVLHSHGDSLGAASGTTVSIAFERRSTVPVCVCRIGPHAEAVEAVVDTGTVVSLGPGTWLRDHAGEPYARRREWFMSPDGWVEFDTPLWKVPVETGGRTYDAVFAQSPDLLMENMRAVVGTPFLLGTDLWRAPEVNAVGFDAAFNEVRLSLGA